MNIMNLEEYKGVYVFAEQVDNKLSGIAFELLGKAKDLAADLNAEVAAVLIGSEVKGLADELAAYGADKVIVVVKSSTTNDKLIKHYGSETIYYGYQRTADGKEYWHYASKDRNEAIEKVK